MTTQGKSSPMAWDLCGTSSTLSSQASSLEGRVGIPLPAPAFIKPILRLQAHEFLKRWHYLQGAPSGVTYAYELNLGSCEAVCCFMPPANKDCCTWLGVENRAVLELIRLARSDACAVPMSWFIKQCLHLLHENAPWVEVCVAYADPVAGHVGMVYQASGFIYLGQSKARKKAMIRGKMMHGMSFPKGRSESRALEWANAPKVVVPPKYRYGVVLALGKRGYELRCRLRQIAQPERRLNA